MLHTKGKRSVIGTLSGVEFTAEVSDHIGDLTITIIVCQFDDTKEREWVSHNSVEEAEEYFATLQAKEYKESGRKFN